jgi:hypothetical protein
VGVAGTPCQCFSGSGSGDVAVRRRQVDRAPLTFGRPARLRPRRRKTAVGRSEGAAGNLPTWFGKRFAAGAGMAVWSAARTAAVPLKTRPDWQGELPVTRKLSSLPVVVAHFFPHAANESSGLNLA